MKYLNEIYNHLDELYLDADYDHKELKRLFKVTDKRIQFDVSVDRGEQIHISELETLLADGMKKSIDLVIAEHKAGNLNNDQSEKIITEILTKAYAAAKTAFNSNTIANREKNWTQFVGVAILTFSVALFFFNLGLSR